MSSSLSLHAALFCYLICANFVFGYVLRKRTYEGYDDMDDYIPRDSRLEEALRVIEEEQRRLAEERNAIESVLEESYYPEDTYGEDIDNEMLERILDTSGDAEPVRGEFDGFVDVENEPEEDSYPEDLQDIENILSSEDDENAINESAEREKKTIPFALGGAVPGEKRSVEEEDVPEEETLSEDEVNALLLDEADEALANEMNEKDSDGGEEVQGTLEPVSEEEMASVLEDDDEEDDDEGEAGEIKQTDEYWPMYPSDVVVTDGKQNVKKKRSPGTVETVEQVSEMSKAKDYIKKFLELEDDENTNLANALNLATLSQVQQSDKYVDEEVEFLRNAIADEQRIQDLKSALNQAEADGEEDIIRERVTLLPNGGILEEEEEEDVEEIPDEDLADELEPILTEDELDAMDEIEGDVINDEDIEAEEDELDEELMQRILATKLREYLLAARENGGEWDEDMLNDDSSEWINDEQDWRLNPFLREIYRQYSSEPSKRSGPPVEYQDEPAMLGYDDDDEEEEEEEYEDEEMTDALQNYLGMYLIKQQERENAMCEAVDMVNDCQIARDLGLKLDWEATDLCNRHQICYTCGSSHGLTTAACDEGYLAEAFLLCDGDSACQQDAENLLDLMVLDGHSWHRPGDAPDSCSSQCSMEYVFGTGSK